jgi:hypothetical protein
VKSSDILTSHKAKRILGQASGDWGRIFEAFRIVSISRFEGNCSRWMTVDVDIDVRMLLN